MFVKIRYPIYCSQDKNLTNGALMKTNCEFPTTSMSCRNFQKQSCQLYENKTVKNPLNEQLHEILVL